MAMEGFVSEFPVNLKIISPEGDDYQYFYGYYDMCPAKADGSMHLCHRVKILDEIPAPNEVADLGYLEDGKFIKFAETTAWNFQQGAMFRYASPESDTVYYNVRNADNTFSTVTHDLKTGAKKYTTEPPPQSLGTASTVSVLISAVFSISVPATVTRARPTLIST